MKSNKKISTDALLKDIFGSIEPRSNPVSQPSAQEKEEGQADFAAEKSLLEAEIPSLSRDRLDLSIHNTAKESHLRFFLALAGLCAIAFVAGAILVGSLTKRPRVDFTAKSHGSEKIRSLTALGHSGIVFETITETPSGLDVTGYAQDSSRLAKWAATVGSGGYFMPGEILHTEKITSSKSELYFFSAFVGFSKENQ